jgi:type IV pilus assembly protein PilB
MQGFKDREVQEILREAGIIEDESLCTAECADDNEDVLMEQKLLEHIPSPAESLKEQAERLGVDYVELENIEVNKEAVSVIGFEVASNYHVFPFDINNMLYLAMQNPDDIFVIDEIKVYAQMEIKPYLADSKLIENAIEFFYGKTVEKKENQSAEEKFKFRTGSDKNKALPAISELTAPRTDMKDIIKSITKMYSIDSVKGGKVTGINIDTEKRKISFSVVYDF